MRLSGCLPPPPRELCNRMHGSISIWALPHMTSHLLVLIFSCSLPVQTALSQLVFTTQPEDGAGVLGAPLSLHCAVFDSWQQRALPVRWERARGEPSAATLHPVDIHQLANGSLFFPQLRERHLGRYVCSAGPGADRISTVVHVEKAGLEAVFSSPQAQTVSEGEGVFLQCVSGNSSPPANITWLKDGTLVTTGRQIQGQYGGGNERKTSGTLHLSNVTLADEGTYVCLTHNPLLSVSQESGAARLTVLGVPRRLQITQGPDNITVAVATEAFMHCAVSGFPVPMVQWFKDGCLLTNRSGSFSFQDNGQLLVFRNVSEDDEGYYHCEASNERETVKSQPAFLLPAVMGRSFAQQPTNQRVKRGEKATLVCRSPHSRPPAQVSWFRNKRRLTPKAHFTVMSSGDLVFHSVQASDSGTYFCRASNTHLHQSFTSRRVTLTVLAPPSVKLWPQEVTVPVDAQVVLTCQVWGHPPPSISWLKRGRSMQTGGRISVGVRNTTLYILAVKSYDEGRYTCEASNTVGRDHGTAMLRVAVSPIIVSFAGQVSCRVGASVVLLCRAVGVPPITYTWTKGIGDTHTSITSNEEMHVDDDGTLHISSVRWSDGGKYCCTAENRAGRQQRSTMLTITAEDDPTDTGKQTRLNLSARNNVEKEQLKLRSNDSEDEQHSWTTNHTHIRKRPASHKDPTTHRSVPLPTSFGLKRPPASPDYHSTPPLNQPTTNPTQPTVTQMQPPLLYLNIQPVEHPTQSPLATSPSVLLHTQPPLTHSQPPLINSQLFVKPPQPLLTQSQSQTEQTLSGTQLHRQVTDPPTKPTQLDVQVSDLYNYLTTVEPLARSLPSQSVVPPTQPTISYLHTELSLPRSSASPMQAPESHTISLTQAKEQQSNSVTMSSPSQTESQLSQTQPAHKKTQSQPLPTSSQPSQTHPQQPFTQTPFPQFQLQPSPTRRYPHSIQPQPSPNQGQPSQTQRSTQQFQVVEEPSPAQPQLPFTSSTPSQTQPHSPPAQYHPLHTQPPLLQTEPHPPQTQSRNPLILQTLISTIHPPDPSSSPSTSDSEAPGGREITTANQTHRNASQQGNPVQPAKSANDTEPTEWLTWNTSQSPMTSDDPRVTQQSPPWLPVLEKHDIPIVVGVGVSLAFIFITMGFYSLVPKNEPVPTSRAAQRNLGVPKRHAERRTTGRTYENRAFEDDDLVAVVEQSPNTSDTHARPPGPSPVTVQMEATSVELQQNPQPNLDDHSITVETYPEPILDTQIDPSLEEDKGCSVSQPSIQLQCVEDWASAGGDSHVPLQDALPPPSPLLSGSPSPSPPPVREGALYSSLTLQTTEPCVAPVHHSLSISHGNSPLLLSHHVSLGHTAVAVDVHFYPAATATVAVTASTHINSVSSATSVTGPLFSSPSAHRRENDQSAPRMHQNK